MVIVWTVIIGVTRIGAIWATRYVIRKSFQTATVVSVTALYLEFNISKQKKIKKKKNYNKQFRGSLDEFRPKENHKVELLSGYPFSRN